MPFGGSSLQQAQSGTVTFRQARQSRLVAIFMMLAGIGVISTLSASIAAHFLAQGNARNESALQEIQQRLERIESALQEKRRSEQSGRVKEKSISAKSGGR